MLETAISPGYVIAAVIDGASARFTIPKLDQALKTEAPGLTAAAFAAERVRASLIDQFNNQPDLPLSTALLIANDELQRTIADIIGGFSEDYILSLTQIPGAEEDTRRVRLALAGCVVTVVRLDTAYQLLEYAHVGDTSLLEIRRDGEVICHTSDQMGPYDAEVLQSATRLREEKGLPHLRDAISLPEVRWMDIENGLRHNYVDESGRTQPGQGCGVIDGLPELADYIESGAIPIDPTQTAGFCLMSDGLQLLAPPDETADEAKARLRRTGNLLKAQGVRGLFEAVWEMAESDPHFDKYPRMKALDDATGIYLEFLTKG